MKFQRISTLFPRRVLGLEPHPHPSGNSSYVKDPPSPLKFTMIFLTSSDNRTISFGPTSPNHPNVSFGSRASFLTTVSFEPTESNDTTGLNNRTVSFGLNNWNKSHHLICSNSLTHRTVSFGLTSSHHRNVTFGPTGSNHTTVIWPNQIK